MNDSEFNFFHILEDKKKTFNETKEQVYETMKQYNGQIVFFFSFCVIMSHGAKLAMKVVESPVSYSFNNDLISPTNNQENLVLQVQPQNFSGPGQLRQLVHRCYNFSDDLVWQEWKIVNNSFHSMMMLYGDYCGVLQRSTEVFLECGSVEQIKDVTEPSKCHYRMIFQTQLVCHPDSLLVYPWLSPPLRKQWDQLETDLANEDITPKGYTEGLKRIFLEAKFYISKPLPPTNAHSSITTSKTDKELSHPQCLQEIADLRREIEALKVLLELNAITEKKGN